MSTSTTMSTIAVTGVKEFTEITKDVPTPGTGEVLIRVGYCGICGSDIPRYFDGGVHSFPQVLGHEFSGTVAAIGPNTELDVAEGDKVIVAPLVPCHECEYCQAGNYSLCPNYSFIGSRQQGAFADYVLVPAVNVQSAGDLPLDIAALVEPLTVALHALDQAGPGAMADTNQPTLILGSGVIGLMALIALRSRGFEDVTVVDINDWVLGKATEFGAKATVNSLQQDPQEVFADRAQPALVIETACAPITRTQALACAGKKAKVVFVGTPTKDWTLPPKEFEYILRKELALFGSWMSYSAPYPGHEWSEAVEILSGLGESARGFISHVFDFTNAAEGFEVIRDPQQDRLKIMFHVSDESGSASSATA